LEFGRLNTLSAKSFLGQTSQEKDTAPIVDARSYLEDLNINHASHTFFSRWILQFSVPSRVPKRD
ncbi:hypothetical protein ACVWYG_002778, partial [Pedobacter sp. UYEF25]